jgi:ABC-type multidrug transport system ATPase subunit
MVILEARAIWKTLGRRLVLRGASLEVEAGERLVVLGSNGSGKSTLLQVMTGVLEADRGSAVVHGSVGFVPENPELPDHLLVSEWLDVVASLKGLRAIPELPFGAGDLRGARTAALSLGQRQRVSLAAAWMGDPAILVLDEPTNGLDAATRDELVTRLRVPGRTALVATHDTELAEVVGTRQVFVRGGDVVSQST